MTPFAGVGVNVGMQDALELARRIIKRKDEWTNESAVKASVAAATKEFELEMWPRAKANAEKTWEYLGVFFNPIGAEEMVRYFGNIKMLEDKAKEESKAKEEAEAAAKNNLKEAQSEKAPSEEVKAQDAPVEEAKPAVPSDETNPQEEVQLEEIKATERKDVAITIEEAVPATVDA